MSDIEEDFTDLKGIQKDKIENIQMKPSEIFKYHKDNIFELPNSYNLTTNFSSNKFEIYTEEVLLYIFFQCCDFLDLFSNEPEDNKTTENRRYAILKILRKKGYQYNFDHKIFVFNIQDFIADNKIKELTVFNRTEWKKDKIQIKIDNEFIKGFKKF